MALDNAYSIDYGAFEFDLQLNEGRALLMKFIFGIRQRKDAFTRLSNSRGHQMTSVCQILRLPQARKEWRLLIQLVSLSNRLEVIIR